MMIPSFPEFVPVSLEHRDELIPFFSTMDDGMCENTFASLFLDSYKYRYDISRFSEHTYLVLGMELTEPKSLCTRLGLTCRFLRILGDFPAAQDLRALLSHPVMKDCCRLRNIPERIAKNEGNALLPPEFTVLLDRGNCDYLYDRRELAELKGKAFHKKKNLVNQFNNSYSSQVCAITNETVTDALAVLNAWKGSRLARGEQDEGDFLQCSLALQYRRELRLSGIIVYADGKPAGFSLGETICGGTMYDCHFEKGVEGVHGIYQMVNMCTAKSLPETVRLINREQDLGDEGLRQAKMTYRPCGMVNKYQTALLADIPARLEKFAESCYNED